MRAELAAEIIDGFSDERTTAVISEMDPDMAADLLGKLPPNDRTAVLERLDPETAAQIGSLVFHAHDSAGGLMTTEVAALPGGITTGEAIERLRQLHSEIEDLSYVYVTDAQERLIGVVSFRDLVFARPGIGLDETMVHHPVSVRPETDREEVVELAQRYNLFGIPVIDAQERLIGMVPHEAIIEAVQAEASEDFAAAMGAGAEETVFTQVRHSVRMRLPWLVLNLGLAVIVALVIDQQTGVIDRFGVILVALMPVVALLGGNAGAQSLAVVIRGLALEDVPPNRVALVLRKQMTIGALNSLPLGLLAVVVGATIGNSLEFGMVMGVAVVANVTIASFAGAGIPLLLRRLGLDPALASNIFLTLLTDVIGFGGFLLVATLLLG
ncbi:MAG TPA: magnesium transporter, partial [Actinobacteria bacterium]|nr:magnesium transporter [Actinomycetota bacterium]